MRTKTESTLNIIWGLLVRIVIATIFAWLAWRVRSVLITVILSATLAYLLLPAVDFLCRKKFLFFSKRTQRLIATILVFVVFFTVATIAVKLLISPFTREAENFASQLKDYRIQADHKFAQLSTWYKNNVPEDLRNFLDKQDFQGVGSSVTGAAARIVANTKNWFKSIAEIIMIPVLAFYFVLDSRSLKREFITILPPKRMRDAMRITRDVSGIMQSYVIGQLILCIIAAVLTGIVLNIVGMKYALVLAVFAGVTRAIPVIGPVVSGIPICILGALQSINLGVGMLVFMVVMHFAESKFIMPILIGDRMKLHPAVILIVLLIGAELFGLLGMFLAAPIAAVVREMIYFYVIKPRRERQIGKQLINEMSVLTTRSESL
jgi:predicted PurR-regulated permease PerM